MATSDKVREAQSHDIKVKELYYKLYLELVKIGSEFSKIIITNLIWLNAVSIGSIPVVVNFMNLQNLNRQEKFSFIAWPLVVFIIGLISAVFSALMINANFSKNAHAMIRNSDIELNNGRIIDSISFGYGESEQVIFRKAISDGEDMLRKLGVEVKRTYLIAYVSGIISATCFLGGMGVILLKAMP